MWWRVYYSKVHGLFHPICHARRISEETKWYQTDFTTHIEEQVPWIDASMLQKRVEYYRNANTSCKGADDLYVIVESDNNTSTNLVNLTDYYAISYLSDIWVTCLAI
jgi:hypothetical protein